VSDGTDPKQSITGTGAERPAAPPDANQTAETVEDEAAAPLANVAAMVEEMDQAGTEWTDAWGRDAFVDPNVEKHPALRELRAHLPHAVVDVVRFRDETTIHVRRQALREVCAFLHDHTRLQFNFLTDLTAVDMLRLRAEPRFDVVVLLYSIPNRVRLRIKAGCNDGEPVPSLVPLWNGANWLERETYDMFGIIFEGHPNLKRMLLPDDWDEGHPLRKDYPLRGWKEFPVYNQERTVGRVRTRWTGRGV